MRKRGGKPKGLSLSWSPTSVECSTESWMATR